MSENRDPALEADGGTVPEVSVILPGYLSHDTIAGCLRALRRQDFDRPFEVVVVDSSPDSRTAEAVVAFPEVRLFRSSRRMLPHAARNHGVRVSYGRLLVFIDPDVYPEPDWLSALVAAHRASGHTVVGALACHGRRWLDRGIHVCKFSKWLPGGAPRPVDVSPTANMLVERGTFEAVGGFEGELMPGDALLSWQLTQRGATLWFEPRAVVRHHHLTGFAGFLRERYRRGIEFADLRSAFAAHSRWRDLFFVAVSVLPVRLTRVLGLTLRQCVRAGEIGWLLVTLPVVTLGHVLSLYGEARGHLGRALRWPGSSPSADAVSGEAPTAVRRGGGVSGRRDADERSVAPVAEAGVSTVGAGGPPAC